MWSCLQRSFEDLLVGCATALILLAMLSASQLRPQPVKTAEPSAVRPANATQDFAAQWRQIADEFYAAHPVADSAAAKTRRFSTPANDRAAVQSPMSLASHRSVTAKADAVTAKADAVTAKADAPAASNPVITELVPRARGSFGGYAVAASLAAGVLAIMLYRSVWPSAETLPQRSLDCSHNLRIELPSEWVQVRPSFREQLRPFVLLASQLWAAIAAWSILR